MWTLKKENIMYKMRVSAFGFIILMFTASVWAAPVPDTTQFKFHKKWREKYENCDVALTRIGRFVDVERDFANR